MKNNKFDQFYTNPKICDKIIHILNEMFDLKNYEFLECAAGTGNFVHSLLKIGINDPNKIIAYDIDPKFNLSIIKQDFLKLDINELKNNKNKRMVITNPPFGKRCDLAIKFLNKSLEVADIVCMILPNTFKRYSIQSKIKANAKLVYSINLPENSFLVNNREYCVKCVFQIWTNENVKLWLTNERKINNNLKIEDLKLFIHNNTKETLKYFDKEKYGWNFAVVRQGYYDYSEKIYDPKKLIKNRQYLFIKTDNKYLLKLINKVDFEKLSKKNTTVLGFSNKDLIKELIKIHIYKNFE